MENQIDEFFKNRLSEAEVYPDPGLWSKIEQRMVSRRDRRISIYSTAAMLVFAFASLLWLWIAPSEIKSEGQVVQIPKPEVLKSSTGKTETVVTQPISSVPQPDKVLKKPVAAIVPLTKPFTGQQPDVNLHVPDFHQVAFKTEIIEVSEMDNLAVADQDRSEVLVYELVSTNEAIYSPVHQPKFFKAVMGLKRDGISLGAIHELKNEIFSRLHRRSQRYENSETKIQTTEQ
ncbi:MAG: hypothetical protein ACO3FI_08995 [Cyclobacteriaceae bacterium]